MIESLPNIKNHSLPGFGPENITVDILRLDLLHPVVSGNKWFKLRYHIEAAKSEGADCLASFGGAYSNHIVATAFAAAENGMRSKGFIRGDKNTALSPTLADAKKYGMELVFVNREDYRDKTGIKEKWHSEGDYWIMEGGYGKTGAKGAAEILDIVDTGSYTDIVCAVGTGTMMAGLINRAKPHQTVTGVVVLKNHPELDNEIRALLTDREKDVRLQTGYHFGGYAKQTPELLSFMNACWEKYQLPTDIVYTSRLLYAAKDLLDKNYFQPNSKLLLIHSGGLQGNRSLPPGKLLF